MENKILFLNNNIIPSFFLTKKKKTSNETLYNSDNGKLISGYIPTDNDRNYFYTHICHHTMKKSLELLLKNNNNNNNINREFEQKEYTEAHYECRNLYIKQTHYSHI